VRTLNDYRLAGYTHIECCCENCAVLVHVPIKMMPDNARELDLLALRERLRCKRCDQISSTCNPWKQEMTQGYAKHSYPDYSRK